MEGLSVVMGNFFYAVSFGCALVGFLVIWRRVTDVRAADVERKATITQALSAGDYPSSDITTPVYDIEAEIRKWRDRAEAAELEAETLRDNLAVSERWVKDLQDDAKHVKEEADRELARVVENADHDFAGALADVAEEAERHWRAGLNQEERDAAWDEHWRNFDQPVRNIIEEQARWWRSIRRQ